MAGVVREAGSPTTAVNPSITRASDYHWLSMPKRKAKYACLLQKAYYSIYPAISSALRVGSLIVQDTTVSRDGAWGRHDARTPLAEFADAKTPRFRSSCWQRQTPYAILYKVDVTAPRGILLVTLLGMGFTERWFS